MKKYILRSKLKSIFTISLILLLLIGNKNLIADQSFPNRHIIILRDATPSFKYAQESNRQIANIINSIGPGDIIIIGEIRSDFQPKANIRIQARMKNVPSDIFNEAKNMSQYRINQTRLNEILSTVENNKTTIKNWLVRNPLKIENGTDLFKALEYASFICQKSESSENYLFIFSDLIHDVKGQRKTEMPPTQIYDFKNTYVKSLFASWNGQKDWIAREKKWSEWFQNSGATSFSMYDPRESEFQSSLLSPSCVPKKIKNPLTSKKDKSGS